MHRYAILIVCAAIARHVAVAFEVSSSDESTSFHHGHHHAKHPHSNHVSAFLHSAVGQKSEDKRHVSGSSDGAVFDATVGQDWHRPIITGCLKECGYEEQTCVTQCQVCMEQNECRILQKCDPCLREAHAQKVRAKEADKGTLDAGGVSMMRDGMMAEMTRAKLQAIDKMRELRSAREGVLKAQREAEWATEERHTSAKNLDEARQVLKGARMEVTRWKLQNAKKVAAKRARAREQRQQRQKSERKLAAAKRNYTKAQQRLEVASANETLDEEASPGGPEDSAEVWKLARDVEERQQAVEQAEQDVEKTSADGEWLDRGLRKQVKGAQTGARDAREELLEARARERVSRDRLDEAKEHYITAVKASQQAEKAAENSERRLREAPLSYTPPGSNTSANNTNVTKTPVRSSAMHLAGGTSLALLLHLAMSVA